MCIRDRDRDGLTPREPLVLKINAIEDEAPRLAARRETQEQVVLDSEVVVFDVDVQDDFGIQRTGLEWRSVNDDKTKGDKIAAAGEPERKTLAAKATFCADRDGVAPVSYTHLDVYKRQRWITSPRIKRGERMCGC